jgi:uncharacterized protein (TIGR00255 family)
VDLTAFASEVGPAGPVTCVGARRQWDVGGPVAPGTREVKAPAGIDWIAPEEMTAACGAGTTVAELDAALARSYHEAMLTLQKELDAPGEITIGTILQAPGVMRSPEHSVDATEAWPVLQQALAAALAELVKMREREGKHLAKDLIHRLKVLRKEIKEVRALYPDVVKKYRSALLERIAKAGLNLPIDDERLLKEVSFFADRSDISEELTRLESHLAQFAHHLRKNEPVGRTLEFITQEIFRELNTLGAKSNAATISQHVVACKSELEKIREQIQNLE